MNDLRLDASSFLRGTRNFSLEAGPSRRDRDLRLGRILGLLLISGSLLGIGTVALPLRADEPAAPVAKLVDPLVDSLGKLDAELLDEAADDMLREQLRARMTRANQQSTRAWRELDSRSAWEAFRDDKLAALRRSLGTYPEPPAAIATRVTGRIDGPGWRIENLLFETRPGLWVTANRYVPSPPRDSMPGILICHSHHTPKEHRELQHMGMTWARRGAVVLVMDQVGHGERRQHPFRSGDDYPGSFRVSRQDYYFRYDNGIEAHLAGESLIGQFVWDLRRGVDLLLGFPGVDARRIALLGAVAGGGDPAAVTAALDTRIALAVPFNFGGPQPETRYPLPEDADDRFNYAGGGSWESTRNLRRSAADGFLPWVIVGSFAPRKHIYAHEFRWDREKDPVWKRLEHIHAWYDDPDSLDWVKGFGAVTLRPPNASHCTHIGPVHRERIHAALQRWFALEGAGEGESTEELPAERLRCWSELAREELQPALLHQVLARRVDERLAEVRMRAARQPAKQYRAALAEALAPLLGAAGGPSGKAVEAAPAQELAAMALDGNATAERLVLRTDPGIRVPMVLLLPGGDSEAPRPVVVAFAQSGKEALLRARTEEFAELLRAGISVCLPDLRGTGETRPDAGRARRSSSTSLSSTALMLGEPLAGARLRDLRAVLGYLRAGERFRDERIALWGDSLAEPNAPDGPFEVPRGIAARPRQSEPLGGLLALLGALYEPGVRAIYVHRPLVGFRSVLDSPLAYVPHDVVVPGLLREADLCDVATALAPRPLRLDGPVDGWNRLLDEKSLRDQFAPARAAYRASAEGAPQLQLHAAVSAEEPPGGPSAWLIEQLR